MNFIWLLFVVSLRKLRWVELFQWKIKLHVYIFLLPCKSKLAGRLTWSTGWLTRDFRVCVSRCPGSRDSLTVKRYSDISLIWKLRQAVQKFPRGPWRTRGSEVRASCRPPPWITHRIWVLLGLKLTGKIREVNVSVLFYCFMSLVIIFTNGFFDRFVLVTVKATVIIAESQFTSFLALNLFLFYKV